MAPSKTCNIQHQVPWDRKHAALMSAISEVLAKYLNQDPQDIAWELEGAELAAYWYDKPYCEDPECKVCERKEITQCLS